MRASWIAALGVVAVAAGCATRPSEIEPAYVPASAYDGLTCAELIAERYRVEAALTDATVRQRQKWKGDIAAVALIGLPVASMRGKSLSAQIASLKGAQKTVRGLEATRGCVEEG